MRPLLFKPWEGEEYAKTPNHSILLLGEAHYNEYSERKKSLTVDKIDHYLQKGKDPWNYWSAVSKMMRRIDSGEDLSEQQLWSKYAFYTYIQRFREDPPELDPDLKEYRESEIAFLKVILKLKPMLVVSLGQRLFRMMFPLYETKLNLGHNTVARVYSVAGHQFMGISVSNPLFSFSCKDAAQKIVRASEWISRLPYEAPFYELSGIMQEE